jgi:hypothetical protein
VTRTGALADRVGRKRDLVGRKRDLVGRNGVATAALARVSRARDTDGGTVVADAGEEPAEPTAQPGRAEGPPGPSPTR